MMATMIVTDHPNPDFAHRIPCAREPVRIRKCRGSLAHLIRLARALQASRPTGRYLDCEISDPKHIVPVMHVSPNGRIWAGTPDEWTSETAEVTL